MRHLETLIHAIPPTVFAAASGASPDVASSPAMHMPDVRAAQQHLPLGVPPPSLSSFPLTNPGTHFTHPNHPGLGLALASADADGDGMAAMARLSISPSYLYLDNEGYTRWQGEMSGLPLLDLLVDRHAIEIKEEAEREPSHGPAVAAAAAIEAGPGPMPGPGPRPAMRTRPTEINPEALWRTITSIIVPELMDR
jgi:hypothetical protein